MIKQTAFKLITILALLASIGGCTIKSKEQTKQAPIATSSTSREDKEAINKKQIAYLKEHEQEMTAYVKAHNANITQVSYDWDSIKTVVGGNGTSSCMVVLIILKILVGMSQLRVLMKCLI